MKLFRYILASFAIILGLVHCDNRQENSEMVVKLSADDPAFLAVNLDIRTVKIHFENDAIGDHGWMVLNTKSGIYEMDGLTKTDKVIADQTGIQPGKIDAIQIEMGNKNTVVMEAGTFDLVLGSAESEVNIKPSTLLDANAGTVARLTLDVRNSLFKMD